jgi:nucleoside-diphosphate-sugar epimerase
MRIIITGANGFVGGSLVAALKVNHEILAISRRRNIENDWLNIDLSEPNALKNFDMSADVVIHCASVLATNDNMKKITLLYDNLRITESVIALVEKSKPRLFINLSSIAVYENTSGTFSEEGKIHPASSIEGLYGLSKFCSEELFNFFLRNNIIRIVNLRLAQVIGKGMREDRVYSIMKNELETRNEITVFGDGSRTSSFISINHLIQVIQKIMIKENVNGTYNLSEYDMSYKEMAESIIKKYGNENSIISYTESTDGKKFSIKSDKLLKDLSE